MRPDKFAAFRDVEDANSPPPSSANLSRSPSGVRWWMGTVALMAAASFLTYYALATATDDTAAKELPPPYHDNEQIQRQPITVPKTPEWVACSSGGGPHGFCMMQDVNDGIKVYDYGECHDASRMTQGHISPLTRRLKFHYDSDASWNIAGVTVDGVLHGEEGQETSDEYVMLDGEYLTTVKVGYNRAIRYLEFTTSTGRLISTKAAFYDDTSDAGTWYNTPTRRLIALSIVGAHEDGWGLCSVRVAQLPAESELTCEQRDVVYDKVGGVLIADQECEESSMSTAIGITTSMTMTSTASASATVLGFGASAELSTAFSIGASLSQTFGSSTSRCRTVSRDLTNYWILKYMTCEVCSLGDFEMFRPLSAKRKSRYIPLASTPEEYGFIDRSEVDENSLPPGVLDKYRARLASTKH